MSDSSGMLPFQMMIVDGVPWPNCAVKILAFSLGSKRIVTHVIALLPSTSTQPPKSESRHSARYWETTLIFREFQNDVVFFFVVNWKLIWFLSTIGWIGKMKRKLIQSFPARYLVLLVTGWDSLTEHLSALLHDFPVREACSTQSLLKILVLEGPYYFSDDFTITLIVLRLQ